MIFILPLAPFLLFILILISAGIGYTASKINTLVTVGWILVIAIAITYLILIIELLVFNKKRNKVPLASRVYASIPALISIGLIIIESTDYFDQIKEAANSANSLSGVFNWAWSFIAGGIGWLIAIAIYCAIGGYPLTVAEEADKGEEGEVNKVSTVCLLAGIVLIVLGLTVCKQ